MDLVDSEPEPEEAAPSDRQATAGAPSLFVKHLKHALRHALPVLALVRLLAGCSWAGVSKCVPACYAWNPSCP